MKRNKAQITLFIILAIILLFVVGIGIYFVSNIKEGKVERVLEKSQVQSQFEHVKFYIETCLKDSSIKSAYRLGLHGGYFVLPLDFFDNGYANLPYYYKYKNLMPSKEVITNELTDAINSQLKNCVNLPIFEQQGFNISFKEAKTKVSILNEILAVRVDFPLVITKDFEPSIQAQYAQPNRALNP